jgi:hypothetical protein
MKKMEALRLTPGQELRVQHGNNRPLSVEKRIKVAEVKSLPYPVGAGGPRVTTHKVPLRSLAAKKVAANSLWVSVISTDGEDFGSNELIFIGEES